MEYEPRIPVFRIGGHSMSYNKLILPRFFLAIDDGSASEVVRKANQIVDVPGRYGIKVNLDAIIDNKKVISDVRVITGRPVFADIKGWNGKRTLREIVKIVAGEGASVVNFYALADDMLEGAVEEATKQGVVILGVTVLTHYDESYCQRHFRRTFQESVQHFAKVSLKRGCDGYILPGTMLDAVAGFGGIKFIPATRPVSFEEREANFQKQFEDPLVCLGNGATIVSCGSPVWKSPDPCKTLEDLAKKINYNT